MRRRQILILLAAIAFPIVVLRCTIPGRDILFSSSLACRVFLHRKPGLLGPYRAPLYGIPPPGRVIPQQYLVALHPAYSMEQHQSAIGEAVDLSDAADIAGKRSGSEEAGLGFWMGPSRAFWFRDGYFAHLDDESLAAVRADVGVDFIECNSVARIQGFVTSPPMSQPESWKYGKSEEV